MIKEIEIALLPEQLNNNTAYEKAIAQTIRVPREKINTFTVLKRSIDARKQKVMFRLKLIVYTHESHPKEEAVKQITYKYSQHAEKVIVIGAGPAGLFAALRLLELGLKPIILERGKEVENRKHDIAKLNREHIVNKDSNYCFGEGGAGTYSDGKLYTRSTKRGNVNDVLQKLVDHGASADILIDAHPHIGTDKLPGIIQNMRYTIKEYGGEFYFDTRITDLEIKDGKILNLIDQRGNKFDAKNIILATGHSSRDIYELLHHKQILIESKPFALGIRIEHPQALIDSIQYHSSTKNQYLPAATYQLVTQVEERGVFSFCMCPGGIIVPAATEDGQIVVNGMSNSRRNSAFANSGIVVSVELKDLTSYEKYGALAGLKYQEDVEKSAFLYANKGQTAPVQRMTDFVNQKVSSSLNSNSYIPGAISAPLHEILPEGISNRLQRAFLDFDAKMKGFYTEEANIFGVESRTSSPVRIPRNPETFQHLQIKNLYPCGEGAGYAGGIVSSALDGIAVADKIIINL